MADAAAAAAMTTQGKGDGGCGELFELFCEMFLLLYYSRCDVLAQLMIVPVEELGTKKGRKSDVLTRVHDPFRDAILRDAIFEFKAFVSETSSDVG